MRGRTIGVTLAVVAVGMLLAGTGFLIWAWNNTTPTTALLMNRRLARLEIPELAFAQKQFGERAVFAARPQDVMGYEREQRSLEETRWEGRELARRALAALKSDVKLSEELFEKEFDLGTRLAEERLSF